MARLIVFVRNFKRRRAREALLSSNPVVADIERAELVVIRAAQQESFGGEIVTLKSSRLSAFGGVKTESKLKGASSFPSLDPILDSEGLLKVGGRLRRGKFDERKKDPILLSRDSYVAKLIVGHFHFRVHHQGRGITHAAIRQAGY